MQKKVLITGGTGFLGSYIIKELVERNYAVRAIRRGNKIPAWISRNVLDKVEWVEGDILDVVSLGEAMENVDAVIHAAAIVSFVERDRKKMYHVNIEGTANVVNMALENNISRFIYISSVAALGRTVGGGHVNEEKKWEESKVNTHYARSKFKAELQVWRGFGEGLKGVILNPSTILGYGNWNHGSCSIFKNVFKGFKWYTSGINGFVEVKDVARATVEMLGNSLNEERFIVNGDTWTFKKLQDTIAAGFNKPGPQKKATPFLLSIAWRIEKIKSFFTKKDPLLTKESARVAKSETWFDNEKILKAIPGFSFTPLEKSISEACKLYSADPPPNVSENQPEFAE